MSTDNDEQYKNSPQWIKDVIDKKGDKMNEAREILNKLYQDAIGVEFNPVIANEEVDTALKQLRELVERKKKAIIDSMERGYNQAISDIADMIYKPTKERG